MSYISSKPIHISLGPDCCISYQLQKYNLKKETLPFDWIKCNNLNKLLSLIENKFIDFFDNIIEKKQSNNFIYVNENWDDNDKINIVRLINTKYNLHFPHDNTITFKEKYNRRINRFLSLLYNDNISKIFYRFGSRYDYYAIKACFDKLNIKNYRIIIINDYIIDACDISRIKTIGLKTVVEEELYPDKSDLIYKNLWQKNHLNWRQIFNI